MTISNKPSALSRSSIGVAISVSIALAWSTQSGTILRLLPFEELASIVPYLYSALATTSDVIVMLVLVSLTARSAQVSIVELTGILAPPGGPAVWGVLILTPTFIICYMVAPIADGLRVADVFWQGIGFPFIEEFVYRGLAIGILMRICGWPFLAASLWPAAFFGLAHAWQGSDIGSLLAIVAITALGGLLFGWLFVRWNFNLWPAIILHIGLNTLWLTFDLGENAIGGWFGNTLRLLVVVSAIATTHWLAPKHDHQ